MYLRMKEINKDMAIKQRVEKVIGMSNLSVGGNSGVGKGLLVTFIRMFHSTFFRHFTTTLLCGALQNIKMHHLQAAG